MLVHHAFFHDDSNGIDFGKILYNPRASNEMDVLFRVHAYERGLSNALIVDTSYHIQDRCIQKVAVVLVVVNEKKSYQPSSSNSIPTSPVWTRSCSMSFALRLNDFAQSLYWHTKSVSFWSMIGTLSGSKSLLIAGGIKVCSGKRVGYSALPFSASLIFGLHILGSSFLSLVLIFFHSLFLS